MRLVRCYSVKRQLFAPIHATEIKKEIEYITEQANQEIQKIKNIDKYQKLFGKVDLSIDLHTDDSILYKFEQINWNRLDKTIPKWSYPFIYELALKNSKMITHLPEGMCAQDFAKETVILLDKILKNID